MYLLVSPSLWLVAVLLRPSFAAPSRLRLRGASCQTTLSKIKSQFQFAQTKDTLPDFSFAGYASGSASLPSNSNVTVTMQPSGDSSDRTADLQAAVDKTAVQGGGVVELASGDYHFSTASINITSSYIVIRGSNDISAPTRFLVSGPIRNLIQVGSTTENGVAMPQKALSVISQSYLPLGATSAEVESASEFTVGSSIILRRVVNKEWVATMGMDNLTRDGKQEV